MRGVDQLRALWLMARPLQLLAVTSVYSMGALVARADDVVMSAPALGIGWLALMGVAASIHYANEYADHETDRLTARTPFSGGSGILPSGRVPRQLALNAAWLSLNAGLLIALAGAVVGWLTPKAALPLIAGAFFGWMYSLPPLALAWRGWGEVDNAALGGLLLPAYGYLVAAETLTFTAVLTFVPFALLTFLNLLATTWPDRDADAAVGKYTLATRLSTSRLRRLYGFVALTVSVVALLLHPHVLPVEVFWVTLLVLPLVGVGAVQYTRVEGPHVSVGAMVALLVLSIGAWYVLG